MSSSRRDFLKVTAAGLALGAPALDTLAAAAPRRTPEVLVRRAVQPVVIADYSGYEFRNGGPENAVEHAFRRIVAGDDVLDALMGGVNIPELDPTENGIGYGALGNANGVVQLDASCMHGPKRRAGAVASIEGVRTPSLVAKAVMELTDHHLIVGRDARDFARDVGFTIEEDLNTPDSRRLWMEWRRRVDPEHWLDPNGTGRRRRDDNRPAHERDPELAAGLSMVRDGLIREGSFWGTINCSGITPTGDLAGVTTTSGLAWKIPGRVGDSAILGAGMYVDNDVGAAGSTGRGEANLYNLSSYLIVEELRRGRAPKDAGMEALRRIQKNTVERRLLNARGLPNFNVRFFVLDKQGRWAGVSMYRAGETQYALCTENGSTAPDLEPLLPGGPDA
jgi:N4-(beta-N-acetylglucosaminyl)-L-asparaginase